MVIENIVIEGEGRQDTRQGHVRPVGFSSRKREVNKRQIDFIPDAETVIRMVPPISLQNELMWGSV